MPRPFSGASPRVLPCCACHFTLCIGPTQPDVPSFPFILFVFYWGAKHWPLGLENRDSIPILKQSVLMIQGWEARADSRNGTKSEDERERERERERESWYCLFSERGGWEYLHMKFIVYTKCASLCLISSYASIFALAITPGEILLS